MIENRRPIVEPQLLYLHIMKICPRKCIPSEIVIVVIENANINSVERSTVSISHRELETSVFVRDICAHAG